MLARGADPDGVTLSVPCPGVETGCALGCALIPQLRLAVGEIRSRPAGGSCWSSFHLWIERGPPGGGRGWIRSAPSAAALRLLLVSQLTLAMERTAGERRPSCSTGCGA